MNKLFFWLLVAMFITGCYISSLGLIVIALLFLYLWSAYLFYLYTLPKRAVVEVDKQALLFLLKVAGSITAADLRRVADQYKCSIGMPFDEKERSWALDRIWKDMNKCR